MTLATVGYPTVSTVFLRYDFNNGKRRLLFSFFLSFLPVCPLDILATFRPAHSKATPKPPTYIHSQLQLQRYTRDVQKHVRKGPARCEPLPLVSVKTAAWARLEPSIWSAKKAWRNTWLISLSLPFQHIPWPKQHRRSHWHIDRWTDRQIDSQNSTDKQGRERSKTRVALAELNRIHHMLWRWSSHVKRQIGCSFGSLSMFHRVDPMRSSQRNAS